MLIAGTLSPIDEIVGLACILAVATVPALALVWWASKLSRTRAERRAGLFFGIIFAVALVAVTVFTREYPPPPDIPGRTSEGGLLPLVRGGAVVCAVAAFVGFGIAVGVWSRRRLGRLWGRRECPLPAEDAPQQTADRDAE
jgi:hypothetical protein